jgi:hypothetical protein
VVHFQKPNSFILIFCQNAVPVGGVPCCDLVLVLVLLGGELLLQTLQVLGVGLQSVDVGLEDAVEVVGHGCVRRERERHEGCAKVLATEVLTTEIGAAEVGATVVVARVAGRVAVGWETREAETGAAEAASIASAEAAGAAPREGTGAAASVDGVAVVGHAVVVHLARASLLTVQLICNAQIQFH